MTAPSLDGRRFASPAPVVGGDVGTDTVFAYHQEGEVVWARYAGGAVRLGFLVGTRAGDELDVRYSHVDTGGATANGRCRSRIVELGDGRLRLDETWAWESRPGSGTSTVEELAPASTSRTHVSLVTLGVDDVERAAAFYEAWGWRRSPASVEGTVAFLLGGAVPLSLFGRDDLAGEAGVAAGAPPGAWALALNVPSETDVDERLAAAAAAGGTITAPATRADWGGYRGYVHDRDGHLWEVAHNPGFPLAGDGRVTLPD